MLMTSVTARPKALPSGPMPTSADTVDSPGSSLARRATTRSALWKQAEYPAANSSSGLVPLPSPPISAGGARSKSMRWSDEVTWPLRPSPVDVAFAM
jgi:hypothetical protein